MSKFAELLIVSLDLDLDIDFIIYFVCECEAPYTQNHYCCR